MHLTNTDVTDQSSSVPELFNLPVNVQRYCNDMKTRYLRQSVLPESDWPPSLGGQYIRLALISQGRSLTDHRYKDVIKQQKDYTRGDYDKILEYKSRIELEAAFGPVICLGGNEIKPLKMLIDGAPGVGKTTLSRKVSRMWAKGELLERYWLVLLLHLRESAISKAKTIDDFFYHEDSELQHDIIKYVKERSGDGVLIIFDGFDELSSYERSEQSLFLDICRGKFLQNCAVVITSRPYASRSLQELPLINRHIEVLGFTDKQVQMCIKNKIKSEVKAKELCMELKDRLDIASICQIPLNCSIVLYVYEQEQYTLPHTLTELYDKFILHTLKRFIKRTLGNRAVNKFRKIDELQNPSSEHFKLLCRLAIKGLEIDKLVFPIDDLKELFPTEYQSDVDLPVLDLMTSAKSYSSSGGEDTYNFLHLTVQEFLAAYWIAHYSTDAAKLIFFQNKMMENRFRMVLLFLSGMTRLKFPHVSSVFSLELWEKDMVLFCHSCYESQSHSICKSISETCFDSPKTVKLTGSRFESLVISNFISYSDYRWAEFHLRLDDIVIVHKVFKGFHTNATSIDKVIVSVDRENNNLELLTYLEELNQISGIFVTIDFEGGYTLADDRKQDKKILNGLAKVLGGPTPLKDKRYSITLAPSNAGQTRTKVIAEFCEILAQGIVQNNSVTEIILNCVVPQDIKPIFETLNSNTGLERIVCKKGYGRNNQCSDRKAEFEEFYAILEATILSNTSLKQVELDVGFKYEIVSSYTETIMSKLSNNTTLQSLVICPDKIAFERNEQTGRMKSISAEQSSLRHEIMVPPPAKRPFLLGNDASNSYLSPLPSRSQTPVISHLPEHRQGHAFEHSLENASNNTTIVQPQAVIQTMPSALMPPVQCRRSAAGIYTQSNSSPATTQIGSTGGSGPAHSAVAPPYQIHPQPLTRHRIPYQGQISYGPSWAQRCPSYFGTDVRQRPRIVTYPTGGTPADGCITPVQNDWQHRPMQAQASAAAGGSGPAHCAVISSYQIRPQPLIHLHDVPYQGQMSYECSWGQAYPSYFGTDGRQQPQIVTYPIGGTPAHGCVTPMQSNWQHRPMQAHASAAVGGSVPAHCAVTSSHQIHPQPLTNSPYQGQSSWAQAYSSRFGGPRPQVVTYQTPAHDCTRPMHQQRPMQVQAIPSAPVYYVNDHQSPSVASCTVVTTTSMPSFSTSH